MTLIGRIITKKAHFLLGDQIRAISKLQPTDQFIIIKSI